MLQSKVHGSGSREPETLNLKRSHLLRRKKLAALDGDHFKRILGESGMIFRREVKNAAGADKIFGVFNIVPDLCPVGPNRRKGCDDQM